MEDTELTIEFTFDLEGEVAKIESAPANPANIANRRKTEQVISQDSQDSQPVPTVETIPPESDSRDSQDSQRYPAIWQFLTGDERELWQRAYNVAIGPNYKMSHDDASRKATNWIVDSINSLQGDKVKENFKHDGYLKIFSTKLGEPIYICRDSIVAKKVPDANIKAFTLRELKALDGLDDEEALQLIEAKILFDGRLIKPKDNE